MSKLTLLFGTLTFSLGVLIAATSEAQTWPASCEGKPPHYLAGYTQTKDQIEAFNQMQLNYRNSWIDSKNKARAAANFGEKTELTFYGHTVVLYLPMYRRADGGVYYYTGVDAVRLTEKEFECVKDDLRQWIQQAIDADYEDHKSITPLAIESFAKQSGMTTDEVKELLPKPIVEYGTTYSEVYKIPQLEPADFISGVKYMYFTPMGSCNAAVYLQSVVIFTPCVRRMDHILGFSSVIKHELIHANRKLQGMPLLWYFNYELFAALMPFLEQPTNLDDFFYHSYLETPWEALRVFGCFDIAKLRKELFRYNVPWGGNAMNRELLTNYLNEINKATVWLRESGLKVLAEFYSDPRVWAAINDMSHDDDMAYRVIMAKLYEPTCLGGHSKTVRFILKHADESKSIADAAWERVGKNRNNMGDDRREKAFRDLMRFAEVLGLNEEKLARLGRAYGFRNIDPARVNLDTVREILKDFIMKEGPFKISKEVR